MNKRVQLNNGTSIPCIGLGVWQSHEDTEPAIRSALSCGYRHIDTAKCYRNEPETGKVINEVDLNREDVFVTTKVWVDAIREKETEEAFLQSLKSMNLEYVDLLLLHWPVSGYQDAYLALEKLYKEGKAKAIGVSNFKQHHLEELMKVASIVPAVNQIEFNPQFQDIELVNYCKEKGIVVEAYSPLGHGKCLDDSNIKIIADKYNKSIAQIILKWILQKEIIPLPKSVHTSRIQENINIFDFELSEDDCRYLDSLNQNERTGIDPDECNEKL